MASPLNNVNIGLLHQFAQNVNFDRLCNFDFEFIESIHFRDAELIREKQQKKAGGTGETSGGTNGGKS